MQEPEVFTRYLSKQRLASYQYRGIEPISLYKWNISLSEALYPLLHTVEISLRNSLHSAIAELLNDNEWLLHRNQKVLLLLHNHWINSLDSNIAALKAKKRLDEGHLIADLPFGFWTILLSKRFEQKQFLWPVLKKHVFPFAQGIKISAIRLSIDNIRNLRNRIFVSSN